jgi:hypothetical protein
MRGWKEEGKGRKRSDLGGKMPESGEKRESSWGRQYGEAIGG